MLCPQLNVLAERVSPTRHREEPRGRAARDEEAGDAARGRLALARRSPRGERERGQERERPEGVPTAEDTGSEGDREEGEGGDERPPDEPRGTGEERRRSRGPREGEAEEDEDSARRLPGELRLPGGLVLGEREDEEGVREREERPDGREEVEDPARCFAIRTRHPAEDSFARRIARGW